MNLFTLFVYFVNNIGAVTIIIIPLLVYMHECMCAHSVSFFFFSFLIQKYLVKTLLYLFEYTNYNTIKEVIIVDDASDKPVKTLLQENDSKLQSKIKNKIKVIRFGIHR